jgi:hypothetical protein
LPWVGAKRMSIFLLRSLFDFEISTLQAINSFSVPTQTLVKTICMNGTVASLTFSADLFPVNSYRGPNGKTCSRLGVLSLHKSQPFDVVHVKDLAYLICTPPFGPQQFSLSRNISHNDVPVSYSIHDYAGKYLTSRPLLIQLLLWKYWLQAPRFLSRSAFNTRNLPTGHPPWALVNHLRRAVGTTQTARIARAAQTVQTALVRLTKLSLLIDMLESLFPVPFAIVYWR